MLCVWGKRRNPPVIQNQQIEAPEVRELLSKTRRCPCRRQRFRQRRHADEEAGQTCATGSIGERTGEPGLADAGRAGEHEIVLMPDPVQPGQR